MRGLERERPPELDLPNSRGPNLPNSRGPDLPNSRVSVYLAGAVPNSSILTVLYPPIALK